jgi:hypothetical protein
VASWGTVEIRDQCRRSGLDAVPMRHVPRRSTALNSARQAPSAYTSAGSFTAYVVLVSNGLGSAAHGIAGGRTVTAGRVVVVEGAAPDVPCVAELHAADAHSAMASPHDVNVRRLMRA